MGGSDDRSCQLEGEGSGKEKDFPSVSKSYRRLLRL